MAFNGLRVGEFEFIDKLRTLFSGIGDPTIEGIGDDCAVIPIGGGEALVVTTDMLVEGVHFLRDAITPRELGGKALAVNLSDIAAMGARPVASFLSVALPAECRGEWAMEFARGYAEMSDRYSVAPAGGDTSSSLGGIAINVAVVGRVPAANLKFRRDARVGDVIAVAGFLGESAAGLEEIITNYELRITNNSQLSTIHNNPVPQVAEGEWLGGQGAVHAMMDISDGLASDLVHILRASGVGAEVELTQVPTRVSIEQAVCGGEDYRLLFTAAADGFGRLRREFAAQFGTEVFPIGRIVAGAAEVSWLHGGVPVAVDWHGFRHF